MSLRRQIERKVANRAAVGGAQVGGRSFPMGSYRDIDSQLRAMNDAIAALRAGLLDLADAIDKRDRASSRVA